MLTDMERLAGLTRGATGPAADITTPGKGLSMIGCDTTNAEEQNNDKMRAVALQKEEVATDEQPVRKPVAAAPLPMVPP